MKKLAAILSFLMAAVFLVACDNTVDPAQELLDEAHAALSTLIGDPSNITAGFSVSNSGKNETTITWSSSNPDVVSFGEPDATGKINASVKRPERGDGDAKVTITATISIKSGLNENETLTKEWSIELTIKESLISLKAITTVRHLLDIVDPLYNKAGEVTISNMTIFAVGGDTAFAYDGTGIIQAYGAQSKVEVGKVYKITGTITWYYGIWELTNCAVELQSDATPQIPAKEAITSVSDEIARLEAEGVHKYATVDEGNFEPIYATVTGKVHMLDGDTSNYNTFIIDTEASGFTAGTSTKPASGFLVYYNTKDFAYLKGFVGKTITMDVVIYTYRSNNLAFAIYYVGGPSGITAQLTDEEVVDTTITNLGTTMQVYKDAQVLSLPAKGTNDATVTWAFKDPNGANNSLINLDTKVASYDPSKLGTQVVLTATVTKGDITKSADITVTFGIELSTIAEFLTAKEKNSYSLVSGVVTASLATGTTGTQSYTISDASGSITVRVPNDLKAVFAIGATVEVVGKYNVYNNLHQVDYVAHAVSTGTGTVPAAVDVTGAAADAIVQSQFVKLVNVTVKAVEVDTYGNITLTFNEVTFKVKWDIRVVVADDVKAAIEGLKANDVITISAMTQATTTFTFFAGSTITKA